MINQIELTNFQSHKKSILCLEPGVSVLVGSSDSGKSAVIRALSWLITNTPSGESFIQHGADETSVVIKTGDDVTVSRIKSKTKKNQYVLNGEKYEGFGQAVPEEVSSILNFSDVNIQYQMDQPFLISETSGEISKYLNKMVNLDVIDSSLKNLTGMKRKADNELSLAKIQLSNLEKQQSDFDVLEEIDVLIKKGEELEKTLEDNESYALSLKALINKIKVIHEELHEHKTLSNEKDLVNMALALGNQYDEKDFIYRQLQSFLSKINKDHNEYENVKKQLLNLKKQYVKLMPAECPLCGAEIKKEK